MDQKSFAFLRELVRRLTGNQRRESSDELERLSAAVQKGNASINDWMCKGRILGNAFFFFLLPFSSFVSLSQNKVKVKIIIDNILRKVLTHLKTELLAVASMVGVI